MLIKEIIIEAVNGKLLQGRNLNPDTEAYVQNHEWKLTTVDPSVLDTDAFDDPYNRVIDIDVDHPVNFKDPIILDANGVIIDGFHRAYQAQRQGLKQLPAYVPVYTLTKTRKDVAENVNRSLNTLHNPKEYQKVLRAWEDYYGEGEGRALLDQYSQTVDALNQRGGTVYRAVWVLPDEKPRLENPGAHWTTSAEQAEEYLESTAGHAALADLDNYDAVPYIISATVGPNSITNKNVILAGFPDEFEVGLVNPRSAKIAIVKQVDNPFNKYI